ncbi:MAG: hypothetical protein MK198_10505 [Gracilimonas sp.]|uniref:hypothetical protein n=1 Tax=Gracilimonas sp. TaxID=1974203 RepID=UPI003751E2F6|nr:hypothetical protein [Gracilimonas sp.]
MAPPLRGAIEHTFHTNQQVTPEWFNGGQEPLRVAGDILVIDLLSIAVQNTGIHGFCVQINFTARESLRSERSIMSGYRYIRSWSYTEIG